MAGGPDASSAMNASDSYLLFQAREAVVAVTMTMDRPSARDKFRRCQLSTTIALATTAALQV